MGRFRNFGRFRPQSTWQSPNRQPLETPRETPPTIWAMPDDSDTFSVTQTIYVPDTGGSGSGGDNN